VSRKSSPAWRRYLRFWGSNIPNDVDDELCFHVEMRIKEYVASGMALDTATRKARERFGDVGRAHDACVDVQETHRRTQNHLQLFSEVKSDVTHGLRLLNHQRLPSIVAVLCLALGIGAATTMFSIADTLLRRPLPYPNGDRITAIYTAPATGKQATTVSSYPDYLDWRARAHSFSEMGAYQSTGFTVLLANAYRAGGAAVSASMFRVLGVQAETGRLFTDDEDLVGGPKVAVVAHSFADEQLGGAAGVVGKTFVVGGDRTTIVGVIADRWRFSSGSQIWLPLQVNANGSRGSRNLEVYGALKPGVTVDAATREMTSIAAAMAKENPHYDGYVSATVRSLRDRYTNGARFGLMALSVASLLVLLIACTNVAALQIARASSRAREIAVRAALGASRSRIVRQLLTESVMIAGAGGFLGIVVAEGGMRYVARVVAGNAPAWMTFRIDAPALAFALVISTAVGTAFGILPALRLSRVGAVDVLRGGRAAVGLARGALQNVLVVGEIALSVVLVMGATITIQSAIRLRNVALGLDPSSVLSFHVTLQGARYDSTAERARVVRELVSRLAALPGVEGAGATTYVPINGCCSQFGMSFKDRVNDPAHPLMVTGNMVTPAFLAALRIPLVAGRGFTDADDARAPNVIMINETFAKQYWPKGDAIGHELSAGDGMSRIIGIVGDVKQSRLSDPPEPQFYRPHLQDPWPRMVYVVRVRDGDPMRVLPDVRRVFADVDPTLPIFSASPLVKAVSDEADPVRHFGLLFAAFAFVALGLAAAGVYATMSFFVAQRTRELGLRVALGAQPRAVVALVLRQSALLAVAGGVLGAGAGVFGARLLAHSLFGVTATEPIVYVVGVLALTVAAIMATYGPARRASGVDPIIALRAE
jgi:predicted permease